MNKAKPTGYQFKEFTANMKCVKKKQICKIHMYKCVNTHHKVNSRTHQIAASSWQQHIFPQESVEWTGAWADLTPSLKTQLASSLEER